MNEVLTKTNNGLGSTIKEYLSERGIKQRFVADKANISNSHLSNVLSDRVVITPDVLDDLNVALGTNFSL